MMLKCFVNIMGKCTGIGHFYYKMMYILSKIYNHSLRRIAYNHGPLLQVHCVSGVFYSVNYPVYFHTVPVDMPLFSRRQFSGSGHRKRLTRFLFNG